ncbi:MAG: hypothetical protein FJ294_02510 [Planctomycetes bacterium]|nr:hypothetical protein [Planctomycetota bacterium]
MPSTLSATTLIATFALCFAAPRADELRFAPADGDEAQMMYSFEASLGIGDMSLSVDGQDLSAQVPLDDLAGKLALELGVVDRFLETRDGRPLRFERRYMASSSNLELAESKLARTDLFGVDGETIVFEWSKSQGAYVLAFKDGTGDESRLELLSADMHLRSLLPGRELEVGATWQLEPQALVPALLLGYDAATLGATAGGEQGLAQSAEALAPLLDGLLAGFRARCEYVGSREQDGRKLAEMKLAIESDGELDLRDALRGLLTEQDSLGELDLEVRSATGQLGVRGTGSLLWDLDAGHAHSFELDGDIELVARLDAALSDEQGGEHSVSAEIELLVELAWKLN